MLKTIFAAAALAMPMLGACAEQVPAPGAEAPQDLATLMRTCVPNVHPTTMGAIIRQESMGYQYALSDSGPAGLPWSQRKSMVRSFYPATLEEAVRIAKELIAAGHLVGLGLTQVDARHLPRMGLTVEEVLRPCPNLKAGGQVLTDFYVRAVREYGPGERALVAAISAYNTGSFVNGIDNGYVGMVYAGSRLKLPELRVGARTKSASSGTAAASRGVVTAPRRNLYLEAKFSTLEVETF